MDKEKEKQGIDKVTDYVAEDSQQALESFSKLQSHLQTTSTIVTISQEDITIIAEECEITNIAAECLLKKNDGNLQKALTSFVTSNNES